MSKTAIKNQIEQLRKKIKQSPRVWRVRGKRVVAVDKWELEDWTTLPDAYHIGFSLWLHPPSGWWKDYKDLLWKLEDPGYAGRICLGCAVHQAQGMKQKIDRDRKHWAKHGGKEKFYDSCERAQADRFRLSDAVEQVKFRILNEHAGAKGRTCEVLNFFKCPYGEGYRALINGGRAAEELFKNLDWYDEHWHRNPGNMPMLQEMKWYHFGEPEIIDVTNYDDIKKATEDGRIQKIAAERETHNKAIA